MKTFLTVSFALLIHFLAVAQNIPDSNFAQAIRNTCPACIDANDNLSPAANTLTTLYVGSNQISDLSGIIGFSNLQTLSADNNTIDSLPLLPVSLRFLSCSSCGLKNIDNVSNLVNLETLWINYGQLTTIPLLPAAIKELEISNNEINQLNNLPNALIYLNLAYNELSQLPTLPNGLKDLDISYNRFDSLPWYFNDSLTYLDVSSNQLFNFSIMGGNGIETLYAKNCQINRVFNLPPNLTYLSLNYNNLTILPDLPLSIQELYAERNQIVYTSELVNLINLDNFSFLGNNKLVLLPDLPANLQYLNVMDNFLTVLPDFPPRLKEAYVVNNLISQWPRLNDSLRLFYVSYNLLSDAPNWLPNLYYLSIDNNVEIACLPYLPPTLTYLNTQNTAIRCLPNFIPINNQYPLPICNPSNNSYQCEIISTVDNHNLSTFTVSPNPCQNYLTVQNSNLLDNNSQLFLYNHLGQLVAQQQLNSDREIIDLNHLQPAVYYLMVKTEKGSFSQKIIKK